jgi:hypothetical protein
MKLSLTTAFAAAAMIAGPPYVLASNEVVITSNRPSPRLSLDQKATSACFNAFIAELLPGGSARVRTVMPAGGNTVFYHDAGSVLARYEVMVVEMTANLARSNELLAKSDCKVNRDAKVLRLSTHVTDPAKLAGLTLKDIALAMTNR